MNSDFLRRPDPASGRRVSVSAGLILFAAIVYGGAAQAGHWGDLIPQFLSVLALPLIRWPNWRASTLTALYLAWLVCVLITPLLQLVPLPAAVWGALPSHADIRSAHDMLGAVGGWRPIALRGVGAWQAFFSLLPPFVLALLVLGASRGERQIILLALLGLAALSILFGLVQLIAGVRAPLEIIHLYFSGGATGFFANRNHFAALLYMILPLAIALGLRSRVAKSDAGRLVLVSVLLFVFLVGLSISGSRSALLIGGPVVIVALAIVARSDAFQFVGRRGVALLLLIGFGVVLPILLGVGLNYIFARLQDQGLTDELRHAMLTRGLELVWPAMPFGVGFGSFVSFFAARERPEDLIPAYINHLHNDWVQILLEGGVFALAVALVGLAILLRVARRILLARRGVLLAEKSMLVGLVAVLAHSVWDYPLRTIALLTVLSVFLSCLVAACEEEAR